MKIRMIAASALLMLAGTAQSAPLPFELTSITYQNTFSGVLTLGAGFNGVCISCADGPGITSTATVDGDNVSLFDVAWSASGFGQNYNISFDAAVTILDEGVALVKSGLVCNNISGSVCSASSLQSGLGFAVDFTGQAGDGSICTLCAVNVTLSGTQVGDTLSIQIQKALGEGSSNFQRYTLNYTLIPVPGAVWLFLSAIGGLVALRRRAAAA